VPLLVLLQSPTAKNPGPPICEEALNTLCILVHQLGAGYAIFVPMMSKVCERRNIKHALYDALVGKILNSQALTPADIAGAGLCRCSREVFAVCLA
jgi:hypothetical protein